MCKERAFPPAHPQTQLGISMSSCALSGSHFVTDNNKSFLNKRNLEALAFLPCKCKDHHLSCSCRLKSSLPMATNLSGAIAAEKKQARTFPTVTISTALSHPVPASCVSNSEIFHSKNRFFTVHPTDF